MPLVFAAVAGVAVVALLSLGSLSGLFGGASSKEAAESAGPAVASDVVIELDSRPRGATIEGPDGKPLGQTPLALRVPRSSQRTVYTLKLTGYEPVRYEIVPERDQMATLELRPPSAP
jgi:hypothetical protein